ncbi:UNVERIFIED_CONTAM: hypothetical protein FKN15_001502 [Acipenser sinensis]
MASPVLLFHLPFFLAVLHIFFQFFIQLGHFHPTLLLPLFLHHLPGQDIVIGLGLPTAHADLALHSQNSKLCSHSLLVLVLYH